jgi:hypothetical protein
MGFDSSSNANKYAVLQTYHFSNLQLFCPIQAIDVGWNTDSEKK